MRLRRESWIARRPSAAARSVPPAGSAAMSSAHTLSSLPRAELGGPAARSCPTRAAVHTVALTQQDMRQRRHEHAAIVELRSLAGFPTKNVTATVGHGSRPVQNEDATQVGLLLVLLHDVPLGTAEDLPVQMLQFVARTVFPVLRELHGEPVEWRPVRPVQTALGETVRNET